MFQNTFDYLCMNDIDMININYGFYGFNTDDYNYDDISDTTSIDDLDLDPDYIPDSDDSSNYYDE
jgi:hypothetical protein